jgi:hypothetical protein
MFEKPENPFHELGPLSKVDQAQTPVFLGFLPPTSNVTGTPNQLFDVLMPLCSGPAFKSLCYMVRRTLGWTDAFGNPQEEQLSIPHSQIIARAGISSRHVRSALDELIALNAVECVREPQPPRKGQPPVVGLYQLKWDPRPEYITDPKTFRGFFDGDGNFTYIPNQFFDEIVPNENFALTKVIAVIARYSIGYKSRRGTRRRFTRASLTFIQTRGNVTRSTAATALKDGVDKNFLIRFTQGIYGHDKATQVAATYGLKWLDKQGLDYSLQDDGPMGVPSELDQVPSKLDQGENAFQIEPGTFQIRPEERLPNSTRGTFQSSPERYLPNQSNIKTPYKKHSIKQQQHTTADFAVADKHLIFLLQEQGFSERDALTLQANHPDEVIRHQIEWLPRRNPGKNPTGLLRKAIEENFAEPPLVEAQNPALVQGRTFTAHFYAGLAGNSADPIIEPSLKESDLAQRYVSRLLQTWPDETRIPVWGRIFGQQVAVETHGKKGVVPTLTFALNSSPYGEQFYKQVISERTNDLERQSERGREDHQKRYWTDYVAYLKTEYARLCEEEPEAIKAFEEWRAKQRQEIEGYRFITKEETRIQMLAEHDSPKTRRTHFTKYFDYSFWKWDAEANQESFKGLQHA